MFIKRFVLTVCAGLIYSPYSLSGDALETTLGNTSVLSHQPRVTSNPAHTSLYSNEERATAQFNLGAGIEYGNIDELFELVDELADVFTSSGDESEGVDNQDGDSGSGLGGDFDFIANNPDLAHAIESVAKEAAIISGLLVWLGTEGYARANLDQSFDLHSGKKYIGGRWSFNYSRKQLSGAVGIVEPIEFDADKAFSALESILDLDESDTETEFDLSGGVFLSVDPRRNRASVRFDNDSVLLTKTADIQTWSVTYGRDVVFGADNRYQLHWGVTPALLRTGLSGLATRIGDITDAEALFDDIKNASYNYETRIDLNMGALLTATHFQFGIAGMNLTKPTFSYPTFDTFRLKSRGVASQLEQHQSFVLDRQVVMEGGVFTANRKWSLNTRYDTDGVHDPFGIKYQWWSWAGSYSGERWYNSNYRIGYKKNYAGNQYEYLSIGATWFHFLDLDLSGALNTAEVVGLSLPQSVQGSLGFRYRF